MLKISNTILTEIDGNVNFPCITQKPNGEFFYNNNGLVKGIGYKYYHLCFIDENTPIIDNYFIVLSGLCPIIIEKVTVENLSRITQNWINGSQKRIFSSTDNNLKSEFVEIIDEETCMKILEDDFHNNIEEEKEKKNIGNSISRLTFLPDTVDTTIEEEIYLILEEAEINYGGVIKYLNESGYPNLTVCPCCKVDDFVHVENCKLDRYSKKDEESTNSEIEKEVEKVKETYSDLDTIFYLDQADQQHFIIKQGKNSYTAGYDKEKVLELITELNNAHRPNVQQSEPHKIEVCWNVHEKSDACDYILFDFCPISNIQLFNKFENLYGEYVRIDDRFETVHIWSKELSIRNAGKWTPRKITREEYDKFYQ